jgi:hypothetical protein
VAAILVGAVVNFWRSQWTLDRTPLDGDEQRLVDAPASSTPPQGSSEQTAACDS